MLPYEAVRMILFETARNRFDRAVVRAFLDSLSLFPIGSLVEFSDGRRGRVIRAVPDHHTRPVVEMLDDDNGRGGTILNLSENKHLTIARALPLEAEGGTEGKPDGEMERPREGETTRQ
jgi:hypothetical protein